MLQKKKTLTKTMVSDLFGVSRSAITQSTKYKPLAADIRARVIRFLFPSHVSAASWNNTVHSRMLLLLKKFRIVAADRNSEYSGKGRPVTAADFTAFKRLVRNIVLQFMEFNGTGKLATCVGQRIVEVLYSMNGLTHKIWGVIPLKGTELDTSYI